MNTQINTNKPINLRVFSKDILIYSFGQGILLVFSIVQSFIIPKYISIEDYGYWQLFLLYITYGGLLHLGFTSGLLVRWAGRDIHEFIEEIPLAFKGLIFILIPAIIILIPICIYENFLPKDIALAVVMSAILANVLAFFIVISQSLKQFKTITITNTVNGLLFFIFILIIFYYSCQNYFLLIIANLLTTLLILLFYIFHFRYALHHKITQNKSTQNISLFKYVTENIDIGIFVVLSNFISLLFVTIDRLTVGSFFSITQFAIYAFAMSLCGFAMLFLQSIAQVFFPYLSGSDSETRIKAYHLLKPAIVIFWAGMLAAYFPISVGINNYLPKYMDSLPLMAILLCTVGLSAQIQILHANFFKVHRKQRTYFIIAGISLIGAVILNLLAVKIFGTLTAVAVTAIISFTIWYLLNEISIRHLVIVSIREIVMWLLVICAYIGAFLGTYMLSETWVIGLGIYLILFTGITIISLRRQTEQLWSIFKAIIIKNEGKVTDGMQQVKR